MHDKYASEGQYRIARRLAAEIHTEDGGRKCRVTRLPAAAA
jgi:hypothetical protein